MKRSFYISGRDPVLSGITQNTDTGEDVTIKEELKISVRKYGFGGQNERGENG